MRIKNILFVSSLIVFALMGLSACSADVSSSASVQDGSEVNQSNKPDRTQDFIGKIEDIKGNKVEILEVKLPEGAPGQSDQAGQPNQNLGEKGDQTEIRDQMSKMTEEERQEFMQEMRGQREAQGQAGGAGSPQRSAGAKSLTYEETGNSYEALIPVGTPLIKRTMGANGLQQTSMQISEVKEGDVYRIWVEKLETEAESTIIYAELLSQGT